MIKKSSKQNGSAHVIIISVIILVILGALGFVFWNNFIKKEAEPTKTAGKETSHSKVFNIPELGISIELPSSVNDLTYTYTAVGVPTRAGGGEVMIGYVNFSTSNLTEKYPECSSIKANPLGSLTKITGTYKEGELGPTWSGGGVIKQFPDSYLTFTGPQSACFSSVTGNDTTPGESVASQMNDLSTAIKAAKETKKEETRAEPFSIKEYGVQFTTPSTLKDTAIKYEPRQIGEASFLAFTTQRVVDLGGDCSKSYPFGDLVTLSRDNQAKSNEYQVYTSDKVNGYYYHIGTVETSGLTPKSTCPTNEQAKADEDALVDALKGLIPQE